MSKKERSSAYATAACLSRYLNESLLQHLARVAWLRYQATVIARDPLGLELRRLRCPLETYKIEFLQPLLSQYHTELERLGIRLLRRLPQSLSELSPSRESHATRAEQRSEACSYLFVAYLTERQMKELADLPYVGTISRYTEADTLSADLGEQPQARALPRDRGMLHDAPPTADEVSADYDLRLHRPEDMAPTLQWMRDNGVTVRCSSEGRLRVTVGNAAMLQRVAELPAVARIERTLEADLHVDHARQLLGIVGPQSRIPFHL